MRYLLFGGLRQLMKNRRGVLIIIFLSLFLASFYLTFCLLDALSVYRSKSENDERLREVWVEFSAEADPQAVLQAVNAMQTNPNFDYGVVCNAAGFWNCNPYSSEKDKVVDTAGQEPLLCMVDRYKDRKEVPFYIPELAEGEWLNPAGEEAKAVVPADYQEHAAAVGQPLKVNGQTYECVGLTQATGGLRFTGAVIIGQQRFAKDAKAKAAFVGFTQKPTARAAEQLRQAFLAIDPGAKITAPRAVDWNLVQDVIVYMRGALLLVLLVFLSLLLAVIGLLATEQERLYIYRLCGIRGGSLFLYIFSQLLWPLLLGGGAGMALCLVPGIMKLRKYSLQWIKPLDFAAAFGILLLFCLAITLFAYIKNRRGTVQSHIQ